MYSGEVDQVVNRFDNSWWLQISRQSINHVIINYSVEHPPDQKAINNLGYSVCVCVWGGGGGIATEEESHLFVWPILAMS